MMRLVGFMFTYVTSRIICTRSEEHTSELQSHSDLVCRLLLEKKKKQEYTRPKRNRRETYVMGGAKIFLHYRIVVHRDFVRDTDTVAGYARRRWSFSLTCHIIV